MRILELTPAAERKLLRSRRQADARTQMISARIVADVRKRGDAAVFAWTRKLDRVSLDAESVWVTPEECEDALRAIPRGLLRAIDHAARNIRRVARRQRPSEWSFEPEPGVEVRQRVQAMESAGCYIPGGRYSLVSTLLMTSIPAQVAGVKQIVVASPKPGVAILAAAARLGIDRVARIGGAQAIAALAYGTESIPRVDKICGPGNRFVTSAKRLVSGDCSIDMLAGPTEAIVFGSKGDPGFIAADLLAQAEHDPDAVSMFVTTSAKLGRAVAGEIARQMRALAKENPARTSIPRNGAVVLAKNAGAAVRFINRFAPEHLTILESEARLEPELRSAGSIFLGRWSAQTFGDYATGTNHVLPTAGAARAGGGLSTADFVNCVTVQKISPEGFRALAPVARELAEAEGLAAHARSIEVRR
ncbi:MAG TPA: histidinol dehydrogenase [Verrucomicrobiae bacterium]|nr:histidinol dehydrogenase [Verrucomicrobiae bacterium]